MILSLVLLGSAGVGAAADFSINGLDAAYSNPGTLDFSFTYNKPATTDEKRVVFFAELHDANTNALIAKKIFDNANNGYTGTGQNIAVSLTCPPTGTQPLNVQLYAVPWSLNRKVVEKYKTYPADGTFTYLWGGGGYGVTQDIYYKGTLIAPKPSGNTTYCSGLAFDCAITAFNEYNTTYGHASIGTMTTSQMNSFRLVWYGVTDAEKLAAKAIPQFGIGLEITDFEEAQEGDWVQLWRTSGSGHNPMFLSWLRNPSGEIVGMRYWGSQGSTNGIGIRNEYFTEGGGTMMKSRTYLGRLRKPRDQGDYNWAISQQTSATIPHSSMSTVSGWTLY
ncbi:hypothetical protein IT570_02695 [Candidatus Sumerlaeota bacterium]|nr:hypothetical protein [Candidatus Sumerlaeota bacterium]